MSRKITSDELKQDSKNFTVINVGRKGDYDGETILNAKWHDPDQVTDWAKELPTDKEIVLYCAGGDP